MKLEECKVGMKVSHAEFGKGKIVHIDNNGRVSVQFKLKNGLILHSCGGLAKENSGGWFNDAGLDELTIRQPKAKVCTKPEEVATEPEPSPFDAVQIGQWIRSKIFNEARDSNKWYKCSNNMVGGLFYYYTKNSNNEQCSSQDVLTWDLTDIRDYDPNEYELKIGDLIRIENWENKNKNHTITGFSDSYFCVETHKHNFQLTYLQINATINGKKYEKLTIPAFDFKQYLLDNGISFLLVAKPNDSQVYQLFIFGDMELKIPALPETLSLADKIIGLLKELK